MTKPSCSAMGSRMASKVRSHSRLACTTARVRRSIFASSAGVGGEDLALGLVQTRGVQRTGQRRRPTCEPQPAKRWRSGR